MEPKAKTYDSWTVVIIVSAIGTVIAAPIALPSGKPLLWAEMLTTVFVGVAAASIKFGHPLAGSLVGLSLTFGLLFLFQTTHQPGTPVCTAVCGFMAGAAGGVAMSQRRAADLQKKSDDGSAL